MSLSPTNRTGHGNLPATHFYPQPIARYRQEPAEATRRLLPPLLGIGANEIVSRGRKSAADLLNPVSVPAPCDSHAYPMSPSCRAALSYGERRTASLIGLLRRGFGCDQRQLIETYIGDLVCFDKNATNYLVDLSVNYERSFQCIEILHSLRERR